MGGETGMGKFEMRFWHKLFLAKVRLTPADCGSWPQDGAGLAAKPPAPRIKLSRLFLKLLSLI